MNLALVNYSVVFFVLVFSSWTDIKTREVDNWLSYGLIVRGLVLKFVDAYFLSSWSMFYYTVIIFAIAFTLAHLVHWRGGWGGADAKLFVGVACCLASEQFIPYLIVLCVVGGLWIITHKSYLTMRKKEGQVPFVPAMLASLILLLLIA